MEAGIGTNLAKCVIKTAEVDTATEFPCDFCNQVVRFTLSNVDLLKRASSELLRLILSCDFCLNVVQTCLFCVLNLWRKNAWSCITACFQLHTLSLADFCLIGLGHLPH